MSARLEYVASAILWLLCVALVHAAGDAKLEDKVNAEFARMSQADKVAELQDIRPNELLVGGKLSTAKCRELIPNGIGQLCQFGSAHAMPPEQLRDFVPGKQEEFVQRLPDTGKPVVLVLFGRRQQVIDMLEPRCAAVVQAWFPGEEGGNAVADLLLGIFNPSGKLCVSYPLNDAKVSKCCNEGYATNNPPLYPFGYGLSYTRFGYRDLKLPAKARTADDWFTVSFKVKNVVERDGAEVAQLYIAPIGIAVAGKLVKLQGFERVELRKGQEREVTLKISPQQLANFRDDAWVIEPGQYEICAAVSATDIRLHGTIELAGEKKILKHRALLLANQK